MVADVVRGRVSSINTSWKKYVSNFLIESICMTKSELYSLMHSSPMNHSESTQPLTEFVEQVVSAHAVAGGL